MILSPLPVQKFFSNLGLPLVGGKLFTYAAGTNTKIATYQNSSGTLNTNPIILNFRGECNVWLDPSLTYKFVLAQPFDTDPPTNPIWTVDNIAAGLTINELTQQFLAQILFPRSPAEIGDNETPVDYSYNPASSWVPENWLRYGIGTPSTEPVWDRAAAQTWAMFVRDALTGFPVPCLRAEQANKVSVLDICPNGSPAQISGEGLAWFDVCDTDVLHGDPALCSARVGIKTTAVEFGARTFNSAAQKPVHFVMGTSPGEIAGRINADLKWLLGTDAGAGGRLQGPWFVSPDADGGAPGIYTLTVQNVDSGTTSLVRTTLAANSNELQLRSYSSTYANDSGNYANAGHIQTSVGKLIINCEAGNEVYILPSGSAFSAVTSGVRVGSGAFTPKVNNNQQLGNASFRWSEVFATNGTINTSDQREKTDIAPLGVGLDFICGLKPVSFRWSEGGVRTHWGVLAQNVKDQIDALGIDAAVWTLANKDDPQSTQGLRTHELIAPLIRAIQELTARVAALESES